MTDRKIKIFAWIFSISLHLLLFLFLISSHSVIRKPDIIVEEQKGFTEVTLYAMPQAADVVSDISEENNKSDNKIKYEIDAEICKNKDSTYIGVGFVYQPGSNLITRVPQGLPAYEAGIRVGDFVINPEEPIVNDKLHLHIRRSYTILEFHIKVDNICYSGE